MILTGTARGTNFYIRPVDGTAERDAILEVYRQCEDFLALGPVAQASLEMVQADLVLSSEEGCVFCGIYDSQSGRMMGIVDFAKKDYEGIPEHAFLSLLMVASPFRSLGLGTAVVKAVEDEIRRVGTAQAIVSGVQVNNPQAVRFWQRMGFRIVSEATPMPDGTTVYRLWKDL